MVWKLQKKIMKIHLPPHYDRNNERLLEHIALNIFFSTLLTFFCTDQLFYALSRRDQRSAWNYSEKDCICKIFTNKFLCYEIRSNNMKKYVRGVVNQECESLNKIWRHKVTVPLPAFGRMNFQRPLLLHQKHFEGAENVDGVPLGTF